MEGPELPICPLSPPPGVGLQVPEGSEEGRPGALPTFCLLKVVHSAARLLPNLLVSCIRAHRGLHSLIQSFNHSHVPGVCIVEVAVCGGSREAWEPSHLTKRVGIHKTRQSGQMLEPRSQVPGGGWGKLEEELRKLLLTSVPPANIAMSLVNNVDHSVSAS